jgi:hypothetical protein
MGQGRRSLAIGWLSAKSRVHNRKIARFRQFADTAKFLEVVPAEVATTA